MRRGRRARGRVAARLVHRRHLHDDRSDVVEPSTPVRFGDLNSGYPFVFGLSYSTFTYSNLTARRTAAGAEIRVDVRNTSAREGDDVVQLYVAGGPGEGAPIRSLRGFQRVRLRAGERRQVTFLVPAESLPKPAVEVSVGGGQPLAGVSHVKGTV